MALQEEGGRTTLWKEPMIRLNQNQRWAAWRRQTRKLGDRDRSVRRSLVDLPVTNQRDNAVMARGRLIVVQPGMERR